LAYHRARQACDHGAPANAGSGQTQLSSAAAKGGLREKDLRRVVKGASSVAETQRAVAALVRARKLVRVLVGREVWLLEPGDELLGQEELRALAALSKETAALAKQLKVGQVKETSLRRQDLEVLARRLGSLASGKPQAADARAVVLAEARRLSSQRSLASVPTLVRNLEGVLATDEALRTLISLAHDGVVELRTESGMGLLSAEDAALCPRSFDGAPLSFLRVTEAAHG
jgi:hypothetical protein